MVWKVDRILAKKEINKKKKIKYLVKWNSLPYSESTWEYAGDINVSIFYNINR